MAKEPIHVLYVEDDPADIDLAKEALSHTCEEVDYRIIVTVEEEHVLNECAKKKPDIILMDFRLPKKDGLEILTTIRSSPGLEHIPVIFISTVLTSSFRHKAEHLRVSAFFDKPLDFKNFKEVFREICREWFIPLSEAKT